MTYVSDAWRDYQRQRFMRPDAEQFQRPDSGRHAFGSEQFHGDLCGRKYADQPREPAGTPEGGQFASAGGGSPKVRVAFAGPAATAARATVQLGLMLYTQMSAQNGRGKRAIVTFRAQKFETGSGTLDLQNTQNLDRDEVRQVCPRLEEVQQRTDRAATSVKELGRSLSPQQYGTAVHENLKQQIKALSDPNLIAEESFLKSKAEARYGSKGSVRVDVLENVGNGNVCVYDVKTGESKLDRWRMKEIAENVFRNFPGTQRIVVSEIRPTR